MDFLNVVSIIEWIEANIVWGIPLICLILIVGIVLTIKLRFVQVRHIGESLKYMVHDDTQSDKGEVSSFGALCISMAATLGTGKIVGVASAIAIGGPGALFWMIVAAIFGMATKYAEGFLAIKYRRRNDDGSITGGPFTYIEDGMGKKWKWLAIMFACFGAFAGTMGIGTTTQMNSINDSCVAVFDVNKSWGFTFLGERISYVSIIVTVIVVIVSAIAVIGGVKRISKISTYLVPAMAIGYFLVCILVVLFNITKIPAAFKLIFESAFNFKSVSGGTIGILLAMRQGISKGIFSNEAGLGSSPIALATAKTDDPVKEGLINMSGTFIDTMVLCLTIGLGIVMMGAYTTEEGVNITISTISSGLHINFTASAVIVMISIATFAFTTIIGWNVYGEKCIAYLTNNNKKAILVYQIIYILSVAISPLFSLNVIWTVASMANGLMAIPNLIGLLALSGIVAKETKEYFANKKLEKLNKKLDKKLEA